MTESVNHVNNIEFVINWTESVNRIENEDSNENSDQEDMNESSENKNVNSNDQLMYSLLKWDKFQFEYKNNMSKLNLLRLKMNQMKASNLHLMNVIKRM